MKGAHVVDKKRIALALGAVLAVLAVLVSPVGAGNVDLATLPPRESVQLTIYNSEDLTLVRETRSLSLKVGVNPVQYSWVNTLIDPTSVEIRPLEKEDQIEVLDTTFPGESPQQLVWHIRSETEGQVKFQVTYFTSGLSWSADYVLVANGEETQMSFDGYVEIRNNSGEDYEGAQVRLVVGVVNLVEKIEELARRGLLPERTELSLEKDRSAEERALFEVLDSGDAVHLMNAVETPPEIVKEGLSEYFIYTVAGEHTIPHQWSQRLLSFQARQAKFDVLYRIRPDQYGERPVRFFMLKNDEEHKLGTTPLPDGLVRVFRDNGRDGLAFLGQQPVTYVPIKSDIELKLGVDDRVAWELRPMSVARSNFTFGDNPPRVVGWNQAFNCRDQVRNGRPKPIRVELRHVLTGDVDLRAEGAKLVDFQTVEFAFEVPAEQVRGWEFSYVQHLGTNAKQDRIRLQ